MSGSGSAAPLRLIPRRAAKAWGEEIWLNSTRPEFPAGVSRKATLARVLRRRPQLLGAWSRRLFGRDLPVFAKIIRTDFPPLAHIGFRVLVRPQEFLAWICREQDLLAALRRGLRVPDERAFRGFEKVYGSWAADRARCGWDTAPARDRAFARALHRFSRMEQPYLAQLTDDLRRSRQRISRVLNEVDLSQETVNLLRIEAGLIHALFGLSLQFHPQDPAQEALQEFILAGPRAAGRLSRQLRAARLRQSRSEPPKSEAWLPLPQTRGLRLAEVQQSSDCTHSVADFFTPFVWQQGARFRKGHPSRGLSDTTLRRHMAALDFSVTTLASIRCRPHALDPGPQARRCRLWELLDQPALWPFFTVLRLDLADAGVWSAPAAPEFRQLVILSGKVRLQAAGRTLRLGPSAPAFVPADLPGGYTLVAEDGPASLLLVSIPGPR